MEITPLATLTQLGWQSSFRKFFNYFIASRDQNLPILSFNLKCHHKTYRKNDIPNIVSAALNRGLENLTVDFCNSNFPSLVLNTKTLTFLKLKSVTILRDPAVDLPSLKVLHLESVTFAHYHLSHYTQFIVYTIAIQAYPNWLELTFLVCIFILISFKTRSICAYMWYVMYHIHIKD